MEIKISINDKLTKILKKVITKKNSVFIIAAILFCGGLLIFSQQTVELDTFHDGDIIYAGPINENFRALRDRGLGSLADVDISGADIDKVLKYNGENWYAGNDDGGGSGDCKWDIVPGGISYGGGNVGIGTTNPVRKMEIHGPSGGEIVDILLQNNGAGGRKYLIGSTGGAADIGQGKFVISDGTTGSNHRLIIDSSGNIGIGITAPATKLDVNGTVTAEAFVGDGSGLTNLPGGSGFWSSATGGIHYSSGNIGIGTAIPIQKIDVAGGDINISSGYGIRINNTAAEGNYLRGNGTKFVSSAIQAGDIPGSNLTQGSGISLGGTLTNRLIGSGDNVTIAHSDTSSQASLNNSGNTFIQDIAVDTYGHITNLATGNVSKENLKLQGFYSGYANDQHLVIINNGNVGIGTISPDYLLEVTGSAGKPGGGSWSDSSDIRLKMNIAELNSSLALDKLCQLQGVTYNWINPEEHSEGKKASIIAQDLECIFPEWVGEADPKGRDKNLLPEGEKIKTISFPHDFNAYLIEAIKQLKSEIDEKDKRIHELEQEIAEIKHILGL
ncbi:MAG: tail fiber domain-containing protein [Spirochaetales bacterium]|nr:tail fiber domain-containing protein [Spirochaetales bacterium]